MKFSRALTRSLGAALVAALLVSALQPARATVFNLLSAVTVVSPGAVPPLNNGGLIGQPAPSSAQGAGTGVSTAQSFFVFVQGNGSVSCTVQMLGSNDPAVLTGDTTKWVNYGSTVTANGTTTGVNSSSGSTPFQYFAAIVTAISGTNAACSVKMNG